ncbi:hypothetical protein AUJ84_02360 [Candidatus Pacearchaeota archaeon CG1_02_32_132]|nr:MAG: hypothetical protein AUJ84_02360 [Candidatus Pacearchaeota archaeon CG1_02_32_132]
MNFKSPVFLMILLVAMGAVVLFFIFFYSPSDNIGELNVTNESTIGFQNNSEVIYTSCLDYIDKAKCEEDAYNVSSNMCSWNENESLCGLKIVEEKEKFYDLEAIEFVFTKGACTSGYNGTCELTISAKARNIGTKVIEGKFFSSFVDLDLDSLVDIFPTEGPFYPGDEKEFSYVFSNLSFGNHFVRFRVDTSYQVGEVDETNNELVEGVNLP